MLLSIVLIGLVSLANAGFHEECYETVRDGRSRLENVAQILAEKEVERVLKVTEKYMNQMRNHDSSFHSSSIQDMIRIRDDQPPCPLPNATMFPPKTTTKLPTTPMPSTLPGDGTTENTASTVSDGSTVPSGSSTASSGSTSGAGTTSSGATSTGAPPEEEIEEEKEFVSPKVYTKHEDETDPFAWHMDNIHYYLRREKEVCNNKITDLNSITDDQLFGFFSTLAASQPGPFCSLCHRLAEEVHTRVLKPNSLLITDDDYHLSHLLYNQIPSPKTMCSAIAPGCHDGYAARVANMTQSIICLECTACMSVTNVLQHKILLQPAVLQSFYAWLRGNVFHNICSELCLAFQGLTMPLFPNGFSYDGCQNVMKTKFNQLIQVATVVLRPERFCSLELQWCELNEQPNALHCLREACQEYFQNTPQTNWLCSQIPDRPDAADAFLNIRQTKVVKEKKEYHHEFEQRNLHDEL